LHGNQGRLFRLDRLEAHRTHGYVVLLKTTGTCVGCGRWAVGPPPRFTAGCSWRTRTTGTAPRAAAQDAPPGLPDCGSGTCHRHGAHCFPRPHAPIPKGARFPKRKARKNTSAWVRFVLDRNILCPREAVKLRPGVTPVNRIDMTIAWHPPHRPSSRAGAGSGAAEAGLHCRFRGPSADSFRLNGRPSGPTPFPTQRPADRP
jgi:hypothetical protein